MHNPIIAALDVPTAERALELVEQLAPVVGGFKVGKELFVSAGPEVVPSLGSHELAEIGMAANVGRQVERLATLATRAGLRGLVCSPLEIAGLRQLAPAEMQLVTPGIRPVDAKKDDQKRTLSPKEAL